MKKLYICDYPYPLYEALIKASADHKNQSDLLLADSFPELGQMLEALRRSGIFQNVYYFDDELYRTRLCKVMYYNFKQIKGRSFFRGIWSLLHAFWVVMCCQGKAKNLTLPVAVSGYDEVFYSDRLSTLMFYLNKNNIPYTAMQHAKNVWQIKAPSEILKIKTFLLLERLHICCGINAYSKACRKIEVSENKNLSCRPPKWAQIVEWDADQAITALSEAEKERIFRVYEDSFGMSVDYSRTYDLLLTNPLAGDSFVSSEQAQIRFYRDTIQKYFSSAHGVLIKPHPRDKVDYAKHFPGCVVVDKMISSEILMLSSQLHLGKVCTLFSSSANAFRRINADILILEDFRTSPEQMESLKGYRS
ncbi:MAG: hypothetical protein HFG27_11735 [Provencibacterium sp.]|jgi:hypothetical protein|nr:hypothetical protein [Provencibacterium sp.]